MASSQPTGVGKYLGKREQERGQPDLYSRPQSSPQPLRPSTHIGRQQGLNRRPEADVAVRRQLTRRDLGDQLKIVGPPTIVNPDELPIKQRSPTTLIEKAQYTTYKKPAEDLAALASQVASLQLRPSKVRSHQHTITITDKSIAGSSWHFRRHHQHCDCGI